MPHLLRHILYPVRHGNSMVITFLGQNSGISEPNCLLTNVTFLAMYGERRWLAKEKFILIELKGSVMDITVRKATLTDVTAIHRLSVEELGYNAEMNTVENQLKVVINSKTDAVFVAVKDNNVIGYIHVCDYNSLYFEPLKNVMGLAVLSEYHRMGVGRLLLQKAEEWAEKTGAAGIRLASGKARTEAHKFYEALGYDKSKEQYRFIKLFGENE